MSTQQKRDIFYNNAPRFLRLSKRIWRAIARFRSGLPRVHWTSILARSDTRLHQSEEKRTAGLNSRYLSGQRALSRPASASGGSRVSRSARVRRPMGRAKVSLIGSVAFSGAILSRSPRVDGLRRKHGGAPAVVQASRTPCPKTPATTFARSGVSAASAARGLPRHGSRRPPTARAAPRT